MMHGGCVAGLALCLTTAPGCGDGGADPLDYKGEPGLPIAASFRASVPSVSVSLAGPEEEQGVLVGDTVAELDGVPTSGLGAESIDDLTGRYRLGEALPVGLDRGGEVERIEVEVEDLVPDFEAPR